VAVLVSVEGIGVRVSVEGKRVGICVSTETELDDAAGKVEEIAGAGAPMGAVDANEQAVARKIRVRKAAKNLFLSMYL